MSGVGCWCGGWRLMTAGVGVTAGGGGYGAVGVGVALGGDGYGAAEVGLVAGGKGWGLLQICSMVVGKGSGGLILLGGGVCGPARGCRFFAQALWGGGSSLSAMSRSRGEASNAPHDMDF
ncbi:uncharacterized protein LOC131856589 [Cryptomeria japonica]|uniref:uncharacterized protein LOC131856589 n=1 Tax=Cryptomeria japonica TaxID=3369 RepID=UPI0027DA93C7|nr:uncharacterized protein LOC131856589 [Cryptomeria japonica]